MVRVSRPKGTAKPSPADDDHALHAIGLTRGQKVRFRRASSGRKWNVGTVAGLDSDGSLGLYDARGRRRSILHDDIEVQTEGPRGGRIWRPLCEVANEEEQLGLFGTER